MTTVCALLSLLAVVLNSKELSSQSERVSDNDSYLSSYRGEPSSSSSRNRIPPAGSPVRERSKSPTFRQTFSTLLGFRFEDLAYIRLIPHNNPHRSFELRRYVFPTDAHIQLRTRGRALIFISTREQIVLSTSVGDICAVLEKTPKKQTVLRAIFSFHFGMSERVRMNMNSGQVERLTEGEIAECPVSPQHQVAKNYEVSRSSSASAWYSDSYPNTCVNRSGLPSSPSSSSGYCPPPAEPILRDRSRSPSLRETFPNLLGYRFEDLALIRLIPHNNPQRIFELRTYAFPLDEKFGLRTRKLVLDPMQAGEQIVLSTSEGDVCAVIGKSSGKNTVVRPIFTPTFGITERVKINMRSGIIKGLTTEEILDCPVTSQGSIKKFYRVYLVENANPSHR